MKLLAVVGLSIGPIWGLEAEFYSFVALLIYAPARLAYEGRLLSKWCSELVRSRRESALAQGEATRDRAHELMTSFRFGPAVFLGSAAAAFLHWRLQ